MDAKMAGLREGWVVEVWMGGWKKVGMDECEDGGVEVGMNG